MSYSFNSGRPAWRFKTARFTVSLYVTRARNYSYDGDDEDGETQAAIDSGELVAFDSTVVVQLDDGEVIGRDSLHGSVYAADAVPEFWTAHRDPDPMNRNCEAMRIARGGSPDARVSICHYFPGMISQAIADAREHVREMVVPPRIRESA